MGTVDDMVVNQINLRIDDLHRRQDNIENVVRSMDDKNTAFNAEIITERGNQAVAFKEVKTKQTIYVGIMVFVLTVIVNFSIEAFSGDVKYTETEKKEYYDDRVQEAKVIKQLQEQLDALRAAGKQEG